MNVVYEIRDMMSMWDGMEMDKKGELVVVVVCGRGGQLTTKEE